MDSSIIILTIISFFAGAYGMIVGAGGGFIFVPALLMIGHLSPQVAAGTGLLVVFINSASGIISFIKQKRIYYKLGLLLIIGAIPGTFLGTQLLKWISPSYFTVIFGLLLIALGIFLLLKKSSKQHAKSETAAGIESISATTKPMFYSNRQIVGIGLCGVLLGIVSSFFGIGGGWLLVPILIYVFRIKPHIATATSIFSLCFYSLVGSITYGIDGNIDWSLALFGGIGIFFGGQVGVYLSTKLTGPRIVQMLSGILMIVGIKLIF